MFILLIIYNFLDVEGDADRELQNRMLDIEDDNDEFVRRTRQTYAQSRPQPQIGNIIWTHVYELIYRVYIGIAFTLLSLMSQVHYRVTQLLDRLPSLC